MKRVHAVVVLCLLAAPPLARAEVARVELHAPADLGSTGYEKIVGTVYFRVDPRDPRNRVVVDLDRAPRNPAGRVEFSADLYILKPKANGNGALLLDVLNRGGKPALTGFNRGGVNDPNRENDLGDRFLLRQGFTVAWVGWESDVPDQPGLMRIHAPVASDGDRIISGVVHAAFTPSTPSTAFQVTDLMSYDAVDPDGPDSRLTVRPTFLGAAEPIARNRWHVKGHTVTLD